MVARTNTQTQPQSFNDKALALAARQREAHGGIYWKTLAVHFSADHSAITGADYRVESLSNDDGWHEVHYDAIHDTATCDAATCTAASFRRPCCHAGVAIEFGRAAAKAWAGQAQAEAAARDAYHAQRDAAHEDNARCLGY